MWGIGEIMGRRTRAGRLSDATIGGCALLRIEHPTASDADGEEPLTEYYAPAAIFAIRPCSEAEATQVAGWAWHPRPAGLVAIPEIVEAYIDDEDDEDDATANFFSPGYG